MLLARRFADDEDSDGGAPRSMRTNIKIGEYFDAVANEDVAAQATALSDVARSWRADNAAGGLPVYAHPPLPTSFASTLSQIVAASSDNKPKAALAEAFSTSDAGLSDLIARQLKSQALPNQGERPRGALPVSSQHTDGWPKGADEPLLLASNDDGDFYDDPKNPFPYPRRKRQGDIREKSCAQAAARCVDRTQLYTKQRQNCGFALRQCEDLTEPTARSNMTRDQMEVVFPDGTVVIVPKHGPVYIKRRFKTGGRF